MATSTIVLIVVVAVAAILLIVGFVWVARTKRHQHRHVEADKVRGVAKEKAVHVSWQGALAEETAVKARAARAEGDVKAAQVSGLQQQAAAHRNEATTSREQLNDQWDRANKMDPAAQKRRSRPPTVNPNTTDGVILDGWTRTSDGDGVASSMSWPSASNVASSSSTKADRTGGASPPVTSACVLRCNTSALATT